MSGFFSLKEKDYTDKKRGQRIVEFLEDKVSLKDSLILDVGCGPGAISLAFAIRSKKVYCTDISRKKIRRISEKVKKDKIKNVYLSNLNAPFLPFKNNSFDLIIMNGVLEWVPIGNKGNPRRVQLKTLKEIRRVLKKNGLFYFGIENRYSLVYFLGKRDHHSGLRFVTFLPRKLANLYSKVTRGKPYRHYLYGKGGYGKLLEEVGFSKIEFYAALPTYPYPEKIIRMDNSSEIKDASDRVFENKKFKFGMKIISLLGLYSVFGYGFVMLAK